MTTYASFPMAQTRFTGRTPRGWTRWGLDHSTIIAAAGRLDRTEWGGVRLDRCCGALASPRYASNDVHGDPIQVWPAGPDDTIYPLDLARELGDMGFAVVLFAGWPKSVPGFRAIKDATDRGFIVGVDSSGGATNGHLVTRFGGTPEPMPMPRQTPDWFDPDCEPIVMADRADALERLGILPDKVHVVFNGHRGGDSFYTPERARHYLGLGHHVHVPPVGWAKDAGIDEQEAEGGAV